MLILLSFGKLCPKSGQFLGPKVFKLQYQNKTLRIVPTGAATIQSFHLGQKYAKNVLVITC